MSEEEFVKKIKKLNNKLKKSKFDYDKEEYHIECDNLIEEFLLKNNFYKVYTEYRIARTNFWYS